MRLSNRSVGPLLFAKVTARYNESNSSWTDVHTDGFISHV